MDIIPVKELYKTILNKIINISNCKKELDSIVELILENIFKIKISDIIVNQKVELNSKAIDKLKNFINRLNKHEPIQYILQEAHFLDLKFYVNKNVLIPRPETEELVSIIIKKFGNSTKKFKILDLGTGSGCIAISLKKNLPLFEIHAIDISKKALEIAKKDAKNIDCKNIFFHNLDILKGTLDNIMFDIIISNPPYIPEQDKRFIEKKVKLYEPNLALFVPDDDPMIFYKKIAQIGSKNLNTNGKIYLEINEKYPDKIKDILKNAKYKNIQIIRDYNNKNRFIVAEI